MAIYKTVTKITPKNAEPLEVIQLVDAKTKAGAINHVASGLVTAEVADPAECVTLGAQGVKVEKAA